MFLPQNVISKRDCASNLQHIFCWISSLHFLEWNLIPMSENTISGNGVIVFSLVLSEISLVWIRFHSRKFRKKLPTFYVILQQKFLTMNEAY